MFEAATPLVEALSIDEAFLDVRGLARIAGSPVDIATKLRLDVREQVGLPITVGIARTKFLAKVASGVAKPDGLLVVPTGGELEFLHPLPVERLWGVGPATAGKLHACGLRSVGDVAEIDVDTLVALLGRGAGHHLHALAHNRDPRPVKRRARRRSIGSQRAVGRGDWAPEEIDRWLIGLVDRVSGRLRASRRVGRTIVLRLRFGDYSRATRSLTLAEPTAETAIILAAGRALVRASEPLIADRSLTLLGVTVANLSDDRPLQLALRLDGRVGEGVDAAVDAVRDRFGRAALTRAVLLGRDGHFDVPLLEDEIENAS